MHPASWLRFSLISFAACGGGQASDDEPGTEPTPYIFEDEGESAPEVDRAALTTAVAGVLANVWSLNAEPALGAYRRLAAAQTPACPRQYTNDGNTYWFDTCTTTDGTQFSGYGFYYDYRDYPVGDGWYGDVEVISGAARIEGPTGTTVDVAGTANLSSLQHSTNPALSWVSEVRGTFATNDPALADTWLGQGLSPDLRMSVFHQTVANGRFLQFDGGVSGLEGPMTSLVFDRLTLIEAELGGICEREPHGILSARLQDGTWVDLVFDGPDPATFTGDPTRCDGKGRMYWRGEDLGEISLDFAFLFDFVGSPW
jgi:hypothetical protein